MKAKIKTILATIFLSLIIPFASAHAADPVIAINDVGQLNTFASAAGNFKLTANIEMNQNINLGESFKLDLNGKTISTNGYKIYVAGDATIKDTSANESGKIIGKTTYAFYLRANRTLTIESGNYESTNYIVFAVMANSKLVINGGSMTAPYVIVYNSGTTDVNGGTLTGTSAYAVVQSNAGSTLNINGGTITSTVGSTISNKQGTINMNDGYIYAPKGMGIQNKEDGVLTMTGGKIQTDANAAAVNLSKPGAKMTMSGGEIIAMKDSGDGAGGSGISLFKDTELTMSGGKIRSYNQAIVGNGTIEENYDNCGSRAKITITGGDINSETTAMYIPQKDGVTQISGGTITGGDTGIEIRGGTLNVTGGTIKGGPVGPATSTENYNGTTATGVAIAVAQHTTKQPITVNVCGATLQAAIPFFETNPMQNAADYINSINIKLGESCTEAPTFISDENTAVYSEDFTGFIYGGRYSQRVTNYVAEGYGEIEESDSMIAVYPYHEATAEETDNGEVTLSKRQTLNGTEITVNATPAPGFVVAKIEVTDADGNSVPVRGNTYIAPNSDTTVKVTFGTKNPETIDNIGGYAALLAACLAGTIYVISRLRLARRTAKALK